MKPQAHISFSQRSIRLGRKLASGATADIYEGFTSEEEPVVLKRVQHSTDLLSESYRRELQSLALVCPHVNVVTLLDATTVAESGCLLLEYCAQGSMQTLMQQQDLTEAQVAKVLVDVARALVHIHSKSVVHRDLRPGNVLLGNDFRLKLADFGSSAGTDELQTMPRPKLSSDTQRNVFPHYQAPEQVQVGLQTTKTDIWGLGCLVYALLFQENAFSHSDQAAQLRGAYRKPRRRIGAKWRQVFDACFQPDPSRRASADDLLRLVGSDAFPSTVPAADSERSAKFSVQLDLFKSSTNSWVKAATSSIDGAPEAHYVHKLLMKVYRTPPKSQRLYQAIPKRPLDKVVVAVKSLMLVHRYMYSGPACVFGEEAGPTLAAVSQMWSTESAAERRRDLASADYFGALIRRFAEVLQCKAQLHTALNCKGNWTSEPVTSQESAAELLKYWKMLVSLCNGLYFSVNDLPGVRGGLAQQLLIEMMNLMTLLSRSISPNQVEEFKTHYLNTASLIGKVRRHIPNLGLPDLDPELPDTLFRSQSKLEEPKALQVTVPEEWKAADNLEFFKASEHFKSSNSSDVVGFSSNSLFSSVGGSSLLNRVPMSAAQQPQYSSLSRPQAQMPSSLPPLMPTPTIQGLDIPAPVEPAGPNIDQRVIVSMDDITFGEKLGLGSSCTVYKGTFKRNVVAIKMLNSAQKSKFTLEFEREIAAMTGLRHPNLVLFMGAVVKPQMAIVFELCGGDTLFKLLHQSRDVMLSWTQRLQMAKDVARGMQYLHSLRPPVLHRDLKSLNLLLREPVVTALDPIYLKITDFGVSRLLEAEDEHMTGQTGTTHWMAPEVIANQPYSFAADVYSYGIVLWEICARDTPYRHIPPMLIPMKVLQSRERPNLSIIPSSCPEKLKQLIPMCWHHEPSRRPTFDQVCDLLDTVIA
jgi:serine/threonine protein kinase